MKWGGMEVETADFDPELKPDIVADVSALSASIKCQYDIILCCQVLEHLPFEKFHTSLEEISTALSPNGTFILSLPRQTKTWRIVVDLPKIHINWEKRRELPWNKEPYVFNGEHYWEINVGGHMMEEVRSVVGDTFFIQDEYMNKINTYHYFFICKHR